MSTSDDRRRGQGPGRQEQREGEQRQRREPLFPIDDDGRPTGARRPPPAPLADLLGDLDDMLPGRPVAPRPAPPRKAEGQARPTPALPRTEPQRERTSEPQHRASQQAAAPQRAREETPAAPRPVMTQPAPQRQRQELRSAMLADLLAEPVTAIDEARARYDSIDGELARIQLAEARPRLGLPSLPAAPAPSIGLNQGLVLAMICLASLFVIFTFTGGGQSGVSGWNPLQLGREAGLEQRLTAAANPAGDYSLKAPPSISAEQIDRILASYNSPAVGTGQEWYNLGLKYGIDPAFAVAFFIHESGAGSNPAWAGIKPGGGTTHNVGNIICAGYDTCFGRFRDYPSWTEGIEDWYRLIDVEYLQGRGHRTVADIIPVYAPSFENDVQGYINTVNRLVDEWRTQGVR